jgi:ABC-type Fe3+ transport system permease subunit/DNA-binding beta-propeller fold protein YncE
MKTTKPDTFASLPGRACGHDAMSGGVCSWAGASACFVGKAIGVAAWAAIFVAPLLTVALAWSWAKWPADPQSIGGEVVVTTIAIAVAVGLLAVILGYAPGKMLESLSWSSSTSSPARWRQTAMLLLVLAPLLLPNYVLWYAWSLLLGPTTALGQYLSARRDLARFAATFTVVMTMILWYWPIAALIIAQGWRNIDSSAIEQAHLDASPTRRLTGVILPLLARPLTLAFGVCALLCMSDFAAFHLAGVQTIAVKLDAIYNETHSQALVARAAWPMLLPALVVAVGLWRFLRRNNQHDDVANNVADGSATAVGAKQSAGLAFQSLMLAGLAAVSFAVPIALFLLFLGQWATFGLLPALHGDDLSWSAMMAGTAGLISLGLAGTAISLDPGRGKRHAGEGAKIGWSHLVLAGTSAVMQITILASMFLPQSLLAASLLELLAVLDLPLAMRQSWLVVSAGLAMRYSAVALVILGLANQSRSRQLGELAALDGASPMKAYLTVHLPRLWPLPAGAFLLVLMFGMTEVPATMILLPAVPSFPQRLLNQMHYARDQDVIVSCLSLIGVYLLLALAIVALLRLFWRKETLPKCMIVLGLAGLLLAGCDDKARPGSAKVLGAFGRTGAGNGEFIYPRAIDACPDGTLYIADKTGRIQHLSAAGDYLGGFPMPEFNAGKPTGLRVGPDGNIYVADTHYHRVMVLRPDGRMAGKFGSFGQGAGEFIYPTDIAFIGEGKILVSEYGGNDRISVFAMQAGLARFVKSFGSVGSGRGQFARPAAMAIDRKRNILYIADACNHRIAIYDIAAILDDTRDAGPAGKPDGLMGYFGSIGSDPGQLRYPYGLALLDNGDLAVCEFGNNRVQVFSPDGKSLGIVGGPGREVGQLAFPWGLVADNQRRAFIVDAGNNRIQIWQF